MQNRVPVSLLFCLIMSCSQVHSQSLFQNDSNSFQQFDLSQTVSVGDGSAVGMSNGAGLSTGGGTSSGGAGTASGGYGVASSGATGDQSHVSSAPVQSVKSVAQAQAQLPRTYAGDVALGSVNPGAVPSGQYTFGFPTVAPVSNLGIGLPPTSTSSCDFNVVDQ